MLLHHLIEPNIHQLHFRQPTRLRHRPQQPHRHLIRNLLALLQLPPADILRGMDQIDILLSHQAHRPTPPPGTSRPSHSMHVIDRPSRQFGIDDQIHLGHVETAGSHVRGDQDAHALRLEGAQGGESSVLGKEGVEGHVVYAELGEYAGDVGGAFAGGNEDYDGLGFGVFGFGVVVIRSFIIVVVFAENVGDVDVFGGGEVPSGTTPGVVVGFQFLLGFSSSSVDHEVSYRTEEVSFSNSGWHEDVFLAETGWDVGGRSFVFTIVLAFSLV
mmetsp:Transcript_2711/g.5840  ORF Transcript_2711/g.5840 Transcript_2711/m.5840 type:complete len:271 (+) Transcript_2711:134-946(+)